MSTLETRPFGPAAIPVSAIGTGCWAIGGSWGKVDDATSTLALRIRDTKRGIEGKRGGRWGRGAASKAPAAEGRGKN